jgi:hypothetical protein
LPKVEPTVYSAFLYLNLIILGRKDKTKARIMFQSSYHILPPRFWGFDNSPPSLKYKRIRYLSLRLNIPSTINPNFPSECRERVERTHKGKMAELPKDEPPVRSAFLF